MLKPVLALAATGALMTGPAALAQAPQPTLQFDRACYTENQPMHFTGAGYTPGGEVNLLFARPMDVRGMFATHATPGGAVDDITGFAGVDTALSRGQDREDLFVTATDRTRADAGQQPFESQFGVTHITFTDWGGYSPGRYVPGKRVAVEAFGWAFATSETTWLLFRKGARTVASVKVGRLDAVCGDRKAKVRVPKKLKPGAYKIVLSTDRARPSERYTWRRGRVPVGRAAASAAAGGSRAMSRATTG